MSQKVHDENNLRMEGVFVDKNRYVCTCFPLFL
jgi:hypothetical protein